LLKEVWENCRKLKKSCKEEPSLVIVDYLGGT
jgi:hypothetical protein